MRYYYYISVVAEFLACVSYILQISSWVPLHFSNKFWINFLSHFYLFFPHTLILLQNSKTCLYIAFFSFPILIRAEFSSCLVAFPASAFLTGEKKWSSVFILGFPACLFETATGPAGQHLEWSEIVFAEWEAFWSLLDCFLHTLWTSFATFKKPWPVKKQCKMLGFAVSILTEFSFVILFVSQLKDLKAEIQYSVCKT